MNGSVAWVQGPRERWRRGPRTHEPGESSSYRDKLRVTSARPGGGGWGWFASCKPFLRVVRVLDSGDPDGPAQESAI